MNAKEQNEQIDKRSWRQPVTTTSMLECTHEPQQTRRWQNEPVFDFIYKLCVSLSLSVNRVVLWHKCSLREALTKCCSDLTYFSFTTYSGERFVLLIHFQFGLMHHHKTKQKRNDNRQFSWWQMSVNILLHLLYNKNKFECVFLFALLSHFLLPSFTSPSHTRVCLSKMRISLLRPKINSKKDKKL